MVVRAALNSFMILTSVHFESYHILVSFLLRIGQIVPGSLYIKQFWIIFWIFKILCCRAHRYREQMGNCQSWSVLGGGDGQKG